MNVFDLKKKIKIKKEKLLSEFRSGEVDSHALIHNLSSSTDNHIAKIADHFFSEYKDQTSLIFTGSNGRQEVCPHSDLDIFLLVSDDISNRGDYSPQFLEKYSDFMLALTDSGLLANVLTIRSLDECRYNILDDQTIWSSIIDHRLGWGDKSLYYQMDQVINGIPQERKLQFIIEKLQERMDRLEKPSNFSNVLYPNIKEGYGGLRDCQTILWIGNAIGDCDNFSDLVNKEIINEGEFLELTKAYDYLLTVRCHLHDMTNRENDKIISEYQTELAARMGHPNDIQGFMSHLLQIMRGAGFIANTSLADIVKENGLENYGLIMNRMGNPVFGTNYTSASDALGTPLEILNIYLKSLDEEADIDPHSLREIRNSRIMFNEEIQNDPKINKILGEIILHPKGSSSVLRQMQEIGILQRLIPEFNHADRLMQFDPYHSYTVDEHSFVAMDYARAMETQELKEEAPLVSKLAKNITDSDRRILTTALMLHDICKGQEGDHAELGEMASFDFCERFGLSDEETDIVAWLVRNHLDMSEVARLQDLDDMETIENFARKVGDKRKLGLLTMLTVADIMAVGPDKWTPHNSMAIERLYDKSKLYIEESKLKAGTPSHLMPAGYKDGETFVGHEGNAREQTTKITVIAEPQPHILENISGALGVNQCNILEARVKTVSNNNDDASSLKKYSFTIQTSVGGQHDDVQIKRVMDSIRKVIDAEELLTFPANPVATSNMRKNSHYPVTPRIEFHEASHGNSLAVQITARDGPGLFRKLSAAFIAAGAEVDVARISTRGHKARDTFFVHSKDGGEINEQTIDLIANNVNYVIAEI